MKMTLEHLAPGELKIDHQYQRSLIANHVATIAVNFREQDFGVLIVSRRDNNEYYVLDGQHRVAATIRRGIGHIPVPCMVYSGLSMSDEAEMFTAQQRSRKIHPIDLFKAQCFAGDPVATKIWSILTDEGFEITNNRTGPDVIKAPSEVAYIYRNYGEERLRTILNLTQAIYEHDRHSITRDILRGLNTFLVRYEKAYNRTRFIDILASTPRSKIDTMAISMRQFLKDDNGAIYGRVFVELYNARLRTGKLHPWDQVGKKDDEPVELSA